jgi:hypothetical protein
MEFCAYFFTLKVKFGAIFYATTRGQQCANNASFAASSPWLVRMEDVTLIPHVFLSFKIMVM